MAKTIFDRDGSFKKLIKPQPNANTKGNQKSICEICGNEFKQNYYSKRNAYSEFKTCLDCRRHNKGQKNLEKQEQSKSEPEQVVLGYTPHSDGQWAVHNSTARFRVIAAGIRWGKDRCTIMEAIRYFLACLSEERPPDLVPTVYWWIVAPTEKVAKQIWNELFRYFPRELVVDFSKSGMTMQTIQGGLIEVRSAYDPEQLVGVPLDIITITEAARISNLEDVWSNLEGRLNSPKRGLGGKGGIALINSSPLGNNYFKSMFQWGQKDSPYHDPMWESWRFETWDNPQMAERGNELYPYKGKQITYKELLRLRMSESRYNQDYLAKFISGESKCFSTFYDSCIQIVPRDLEPEQRKEFLKKWREPETYQTYVVGYDPASVSDIPAVVVIEQGTGKLKRAYNLKGYNWNEQYDKLTQIARKYNSAIIAFSRTGHETIEEELIKRGNSCSTYTEQGQNKANFVNRLEVVVENRELQVLDDGTSVIDELIRQFCDYSRIEKINRDGIVMRTEYSNVDEPHDDFVSATYIAFQAITTPDEILPFMGMVAGIQLGL